MNIMIDTYKKADELSLQSIIICDADARYASTIEGVLSRFDAEDKKHKLYTIKLNSKIIGLVLTREFAPKKIFVWQFLISNPYQNRGYGTVALECFLNKLISEGYVEATTTIKKENTRALKLFSKFDFIFTSLAEDEMNFMLDLGRTTLSTE